MTAFDTAQAEYDAMEPPEYELAEPRPVDLVLEDIVALLDSADELTESAPVHRLSDQQATVGIWIDGHEYSLTLNRED